MARAPFQKLKILYLLDYLLRCSDESHPVTVAQLIQELHARGISAERKSIYDDLEALRTYGIDLVQAGQGRNSAYYVASREFELPELKLLVDSVQSSKFITQKKTMSLIKKIESLTSIYQARELNRQVLVKNRIKTMNESIYYNVDEIHRGIAANRKIRFHYFEYNMEKQRQLRRNGEWYVMSPYALTWDDENYYLVAFDSQAGIIKHFRVDKMTHIGVTQEPRDGQEVYAAMDMGLYARQVFGMFSGELASVRLRFERGLVGAVLDRLGQDVMLVPEDEEHFTVRADVVVSPQFFAWLCGFGTRAKVLEPEHVVSAMADYVQRISALYQECEPEQTKPAGKEPNP